MSIAEIKYQEELSKQSFLKDFIPLNDLRIKKVQNSHSHVDNVLIDKLNSGDYPAFTIIFSTYYKDLVVFATRYTHEISNAEEIVQDTFVKLWEDRKSVTIQRSLKSFLLKSVQNRCIDWLRHNKIKQAYYQYIIESSLPYDSDTENYILYSELHRDVENAIEMLPGKVAEVFRMNRYQGLKYHEIAGILNISVRTVEVRIGKALNLLRNYLRNHLILI